MNSLAKSLIVVCFSLAAGSAMASPHLTPQQCHGYPFKKNAQPATHRQLMNELGELEAVGYQPDADNATYPNDIDRAEHKLRVEYRRDCLPAAQANSATIVR